MSAMLLSFVLISLITYYIYFGMSANTITSKNEFFKFLIPYHMWIVQFKKYWNSLT